MPEILTDLNHKMLMMSGFWDVSVSCSCKASEELLMPSEIGAFL